MESVGLFGQLLALLEDGLLRSGGVAVRDQQVARTCTFPEPDAAWLLELALAAGLLGRRRAAPRRVAAHPDLRHLARAGPAEGGAGGRLAGRHPAATALVGSSGKRRTHSPPTWCGTPLRCSAALAGHPAGRGRAPRTSWQCRAGAPAAADRAGAGPGDGRRGGPARDRRRRGAAPRWAAVRRRARMRGHRHARSAARAGRPRARPAGSRHGARSARRGAGQHAVGSGRRDVFRVGVLVHPGALDSGWSASDLHDFFTRASRTPVPQALDYLVHHAASTAGCASGRCDRGYRRRSAWHPRAALPGVGGRRRRLPGVLVSGLAADEVLCARRASHRPARTRVAPASGAPPGSRTPDGPRARPAPAGRPPTSCYGRSGW